MYRTIVYATAAQLTVCTSVAMWSHIRTEEAAANRSAIVVPPLPEAQPFDRDAVPTGPLPALQVGDAVRVNDAGSPVAGMVGTVVATGVEPGRHMVVVNGIGYTVVHRLLDPVTIRQQR